MSTIAFNDNGNGHGKPATPAKISNGKKLGGVTGKGFLPGRVSNASGRPKGIAQLIRLRTKNGLEMVDIALKIMRGKLEIETKYIRDGEVLSYKSTPSFKDRLSALEWLSERGFGKVPDNIMLQADGGWTVVVKHAHELDR